jgi:glycosyltransferase involved in cell wall biosynthesis
MSTARANVSSNLSEAREAALASPLRGGSSSRPVAPIALFVYNRIEFVSRTVESLLASELAPLTDLYVFSDAPKDATADNAVRKLREFVHKIKGFKSLTVIEREQNFGLNKSLISGVSHLCKEFGRIIVVEDDVTTAPDFLAFMNLALERYADEPTVFSVGGFNIPYVPPAAYNLDAVFSYRFHPWGWATWGNRWEKADWSVGDFREFIADRERRKQFDRGGNDLTWMLSRQVNGKIDGFWDTIWNYVHSKYDAVQLIPVVPKTYNIGCGTGDHGHMLPFEQVPLSPVRKSEYRLPEVGQMDQHYIAELQRICHRPFIRKFARDVLDAVSFRQKAPLNGVPR